MLEASRLWTKGEARSFTNEISANNEISAEEDWRDGEGQRRSEGKGNEVPRNIRVVGARSKRSWEVDARVGEQTRDDNQASQEIQSVVRRRKSPSERVSEQTNRAAQKH